MGQINSAIIKMISKTPVFIFVSLIKIYQFFIRPILGNRCRFYPSCSDYSLEAMQQYGIGYGSFLSCKRMLCCHPWHPGGINPVPQRDKKC